MTTTLSGLLNAVHLDEADSVRIELGSRLCLRIPQGPRVYCHIALRGSIAVHCENQPTVTLQPGEAAMLIHGSQHELCVGTGDEAVDFDHFRVRRGDDAPPTLPLGSGRTAAVVLSTALFQHQGRRATASQLVPDLVHLSSASTALWGLPLPALDTLEQLCRGPGATALIASIGLMLNVQTVRLYAVPATSAQADLPPGMLRVPQIATAWRLLQSNPGSPWTIKTLAQAVGLSRSAFAEKFAAALDEPPMHYLARVRMERAAALLQRGDLSVSAVARQIGYTSLSAFSREFKRRYGATPRQFAAGNDPARINHP